ncbi:carboxylesterase, putative [Talaromyces stipitatus ATCC 10500]|uniref:Carboxylic ester hydrolase n=1 Tax=Talaromyces stipitatus (strain ATCC 10500 / CBS 375.48 / QM 6759 / NRRL 1006) TaxID=441959 RepID=B8M617_TALSN|nr:carboxylesterase, putative [Talaromyces stipitatus ATCC 10500]EED19017.1 carboxylesterase, putative [Talaromyces stipitatus ATCC 10500]
MIRSIFLLSLLRGLLAHGFPAASSKPVVTLDYATYRGTRLNAGVDQYLGMCFAASPVGELRFRAPQDPPKMSGIQEATEFGPSCVGTNQNVTSSLSEDCLFVNVFTPSSASTTSKLPVWVYIQGGGYALNSNQNYNGTGVIENSEYGLVFVNFNYRVGALGFLASEQVRRNGDLNAGLLDQRKVLRWVQKYIVLFGGDPAHVVIHGASAGAGSVAHHLAAYNGQDEDLFIGAVPESTFWPTLRTVNDMKPQFSRFAHDAGCGDAADTMACLRSLDINKIQIANVVSAFPDGPSSPLPNWYFLPVIDGGLVSDQLSRAFQQGKIKRVPMIVGDDTDEGSFFAINATNELDISRFFKANYPNLNERQLQAINWAYPLMPAVAEHAEYFPSASAAYGESTFTCPGNLMAGSMAFYLGPNKVWNYRYNVRDPTLVVEGIGVPHTFETTAIFGYPYAENIDPDTYAPGGLNAAMVPLTMKYWISFVTTLSPNTSKLKNAPDWEPWGGIPARRLKLELNATTMEIVPESQRQRCELWWSLANTMQI